MKSIDHAVFAAAVFALTTTAFGAGNGLMGEYFNNDALLGSAILARTDPTVNFTWNSSGPGNPVTGDHFSARWTGQVEAPATGAFRFATFSNNGVRLWVNNALVIDHWTSHSNAKDTSAPVMLTSGQKYAVRMEFYETSGTAEARLLWTPPGQAEAVIPQASLTSTGVMAGAPPVYLSDLTPTFTANGWGPYERDRSNGETGAHDGRPISIGGVTFSRGLGVHARSELRYTLGGKFQIFSAFMGVDDEVANRGSVVFQVWLDGTMTSQSTMLKGADAPKPVNIAVAGKNELKLIVLDGGDGMAYDHSDWADARLLAIPVQGGGGGNPTGPSLPAAPINVTATGGDKQVMVAWSVVTGAATYNVYRGTSAGGEGTMPVMSGITGTAFSNTGLTNGTRYYFRVAAVNAGGVGAQSSEVNAMPNVPPPAAPSDLSAAAGDARVVLSWTAISGATSYNIFRGATAGGEASSPIATGVTASTFTNTGLTNGNTYFYKITALNGAAASAMSNEASATPQALAAPAGLSASAGNLQVVLSWNSVTGATSYNIYRGTSANGESNTAIATGVTGVTFTNTGLTNGTTYFYKVAAVNATSTSQKSAEASAMPTAPGILLTDAQKDAYRFLRQSTWGPTKAMVDHVVAVGKPAFLDEQFAAPITPYPDTLIDMPNMELVSEQFFQNAILGQDQLRQRVAWALSQIYVVSAIKVDNTDAMVPYIRMLHQHAFDNLLDVMHDVSLSPAMGEFLDMVNNKKADTKTGTLPNENYAREWLQLLSIGLQELNDDGTPKLGTTGQPIPTYDQSTVADMARVLTGWTYGDAKATDPTNLNQPYYAGPMKPVAKYHDTGAKTVLGTAFPAGQTALQDFTQALNLVFNHHNVGPFISRQLIQRLVTSNPSPAYIRDITNVFNNNGSGVRGDLKAVVKAILLHPEAANGTPSSGKFSEPALFELTVSRALGAKVTDHPFLSDYSQDMGQQIWFAPSVFNYFSPNYKAGPVFAPEMQIWTTATAMTRTNFVASLISGGFGSDVTIDLTPYTAVAADPNALADTVNALIMGGQMSSQMKGAIVTAIAATKNTTERVRTALYLAAVSMQYQVEH